MGPRRLSIAEKKLTGCRAKAARGIGVAAKHAAAGVGIRAESSSGVGAEAYIFAVSNWRNGPA